MNRIYKILWLYFIFIFLILKGNAQLDSLPKTNIDMLMYSINDSMPVFNLDSIILLPKIRFANYYDLKKYNWIRHKVYKVYPFAKLSGEDIQKLDTRLSKMNKQQQKRYMRIIKKWIQKEFEPKLKNLTQTEGRILSKLFHRQTGKTVYEFLKKYKNGWTAFWYQNIAKLYNINLKVKFNPQQNKEDYWIEYILQKAFQEEILEPQPNKLQYKFIDLQNKWGKKSIPKPNKK